MKPIVSVIVCTRNRAGSLRETLRSIASCAVPEDLPTELLVIDNASTDDTREVVAAAGLANMPVRLLQEQRTGLGFARNRALAEANGDVFLFTDDDVRVPANWIESMCRPILDLKTDAVAGGIQIAPDLDRHWLKGILRALVGSTERMVDNQDFQLVGANMAFSRRILAKVPGFDLELGAGALGFGEETLFSRQLLRAGFRISGNWGTAVEHHFEPERLSRKTFLQIAEKIGRTNAYLHHHWEDGRVWAPQLGELWFRTKLVLRNSLKSKKTVEDAPSPWEVIYTLRLNFFHHYRVERLRPRNYDKFGLVKLHGIV